MMKKTKVHPRPVSPRPTLARSNSKLGTSGVWGRLGDVVRSNVTKVHDMFFGSDNVEEFVATEEFEVVPQKGPVLREKAFRYLEMEQKIKSMVGPGHHADHISEDNFYVTDVDRPKWMLDPDSKQKYYWDTLIVLAVLYNVVIIPFSTAFPRIDFTDPAYAKSSAVYQDVFQYLVDGLFAVDIVLSFRTGFLLEDTRMSRGVKCYDAKVIAKRYSKWFWVDFVAVLPVELLGIFAVKHKKTRDLLNFTKFLRMARLIKVSRYLARLDSSKHGNTIRILKLLFFFMFLVHVFGCLWWFIGQWQGCEWRNPYTGGPWIYELDKQFPCNEKEGMFVADIATKYSLSVYFAMTTMTSVGYGDILPYTTAERIFCMFVQIVGAVASATLIGIVSSILVQFDASNARFRDRMNLIREFAEHFRLPRELTDQLFRHFNSLWEVKKGLDVHEVLLDLPLQLQEEVVMQMLEEVVLRTPMLCDLEQSFVEVFVMGLQQQICLPGVHIIEEDEIGKEVFIVSRGLMEAVKDDHLVQMIGESSVVGFTEILHNSRAPCTVRGVTQCDLYNMPKGYLMETLVEFPEVRQKFSKYASAQSKETWLRIKAVLPAANDNNEDEETSPRDSKNKDKASPRDTNDKGKGATQAADPIKPTETPRRAKRGPMSVMRGPPPAVFNTLQAQLDHITLRLGEVEEMYTEVIHLGQRVNSLTEYKLYCAPAEQSDKKFKLLSQKLDVLIQALVQQQALIASSAVQ